MPFGTVFFGVSMVPFGSFGTPGDVMSAWYGIRPLCGDPMPKTRVPPPGTMSLLGATIATLLLMATETVRIR